MSDHAEGMVERVARAIYASAGRSPPEGPWEDADQEVRDWISDHARAAIEAMREPTPRVSTAIMIAAGRVAKIYDGEVCIRGDAGEFILRALVDAALKPEGGETP